MASIITLTLLAGITQAYHPCVTCFIAELCLYPNFYFNKTKDFELTYIVDITTIELIKK